MPDYIYLLENRLSPDQQQALKQVREASREAGMTVFLTGGAVRDLTSGSPVRDLDFSVQGEALKLKKTLQDGGARFWGEHKASGTLFLRFPGGVRVEVSSTRREEYPKVGHPVYHPATILEDLRRRDFTANAMALSLNEGSYGLLMDPLNGVADIEARLLRLVSNYGFLEEPVRLIRATRLAARLGWELEDRTKVRFQNAREENAIDHLSAYQQGYELEEIAHEEDGLKILKVLEAEGWMQKLFPGWGSAQADVTGLEEMREALLQLQMQGVNPDTSTAQMQLLTAKLSSKDIHALKHLIVRPGFVEDWERLDSDAKEFAKVLTGKQAATPSATWKLFTSWNPEAILWLRLTGKSAPVKEKYENFFAVWPETRQKIPYALLQEMRITLEMDGYQDLLKNIFLELLDGKLATEEEMRAFLEPFSPPAPPPPVSIKRTRSKRSEPKIKIDDEEDEDIPIRLLPDDLEDKDDDLEGLGDDEDEHEAPLKPKTSSTVHAPVPPASGPVPKVGDKGAAKVTPKPPAKAEAKPARQDSKPAKPPAQESKVPAKQVAKTPAKPAVAPNAVSKPPVAKTAAKHASVTAKPAKHEAARNAHAKKSVPAKPTVQKKSASKPAPKSKLPKTVAKPKPAAKHAKKAPPAATKKKR